MNAESLGHFFFSQNKSERLVKAGTSTSFASTSYANSTVATEARCAKGVCEVGWKPNQQSSIQAESAQDELA
jgi:hypothetical protein